MRQIRDLKEENRKMVDRYQQMQKQVSHRFLQLYFHCSFSVFLANYIFLLDAYVILCFLRSA